MDLGPQVGPDSETDNGRAHCSCRSSINRTWRKSSIHPSQSERLIACLNPLLAEERTRKRNELLEATEKQLNKIVKSTQRKKNHCAAAGEIGLAVGPILGRYKMGKHFKLFIEDDGFRFRAQARQH